jgi:hypothetical protein
MPLVSPSSRRHRKITADDIRLAFERTQRFDLVIVAARGNAEDPGALLFAGLVDGILPIVRGGTGFQSDVTGVATALGGDAGKLRGAVTLSAAAPA